MWIVKRKKYKYESKIPEEFPFLIRYRTAPIVPHIDTNMLKQSRYERNSLEKNDVCQVMFKKAIYVAKRTKTIAKTKFTIILRPYGNSPTQCAFM